MLQELLDDVPTPNRLMLAWIMEHIAHIIQHVRRGVGGADKWAWHYTSGRGCCCVYGGEGERKQTEYVNG